MFKTFQTLSTPPDYFLSTQQTIKMPRNNNNKQLAPVQGKGQLHAKAKKGSETTPKFDLTKLAGVLLRGAADNSIGIQISWMKKGEIAPFHKITGYYPVSKQGIRSLCARVDKDLNAMGLFMTFATLGFHASEGTFGEKTDVVYGGIRMYVAEMDISKSSMAKVEEDAVSLEYLTSGGDGIIRFMQGLLDSDKEHKTENKRLLRNLSEILCVLPSNLKDAVTVVLNNKSTGAEENTDGVSHLLSKNRIGAIKNIVVDQAIKAAENCPIAKNALEDALEFYYEPFVSIDGKPSGKMSLFSWESSQIHVAHQAWA